MRIIPLIPKWEGKLPLPKLVIGVGDFNKGEACIMSEIVAMERLANGESIGFATDKSECVCPVIRTLAIRVNDAIKDTQRTQWAMEMIPKMIGTKGDGKSKARAFLCADRAVRVFAAEAMKAAGKIEAYEKLRTLLPIVDKQTALSGEKECSAADASAYASAASAADASAYASAASAYAASADDAYAYAYAADASAYASAAASRAASAASAASAAYAAAFDGTGAKIQLLSDICAL